MKVLITSILLLLLICEVQGQQIKNTKTLDDNFQKFDTAAYYKRIEHYDPFGADPNHLRFKDGTEIFRSAHTDSFEEEVHLPKPSFLKILRTFYPSGFIKMKGYSFGDLNEGANGVKVGNWYYFNEQGKLTETVNEDQKFGNVDYPKILAILEKDGLINIKTGKNREQVTAFFERNDDGTSVWKLEVITEFHADDHAKVWRYSVDGSTGKILERLRLTITYTEIDH